ncbi:hypothetical protein GCM10022281_11260 [Sphingomonas rosea]|uniref:DUF4398 domain-containing protein n=2 Tax=Sphingomonas rosea TaxID=335605 RepID=A0ABP7TYV6_9SPHN
MRSARELTPEVEPMKSAVPVVALLLLAACQRTPQEQQIHDIKAQADERADAVEQAADGRADPMDAQAKALREQAKQVGGYDGKRLEVQADALEKEADLTRAQGNDRGDAIRAEADAKAKALESR